VWQITSDKEENVIMKKIKCWFIKYHSEEIKDQFKKRDMMTVLIFRKKKKAVAASGLNPKNIIKAEFIIYD
jgi:hypothetical protein